MANPLLNDNSTELRKRIRAAEEYLREQNELNFKHFGDRAEEVLKRIPAAKEFLNNLIPLNIKQLK